LSRAVAWLGNRPLTRLGSPVYNLPMLFHTWVFLVFCLIVFPVYLLVRTNNRLMNIWFLIASYTFYGWWNPWYLLLLFGTSAIDYWMVLLMERKQSTRKLWLIISLVSNFGFLGYFKYSTFITDNLNAIFSLSLPDPAYYPSWVLSNLGAPDDWLFTKVILPIGISFHTFQSMSYTIDAYFGSIKTERSFIRFLTFVSFFPQLVAGPIERAGNLLPQLQGTPTITRQCIADGMSLFLVGFFKKVALADYLARYVDQVYDSPTQFQAPALILATVAFGWQIYFDFSGYTDMARGIAEMMGFRLMLNFNNPYTATGLGDFWGRWHISLSTWFKDYVYFPLGGNRGALWETYRNMFITMVISGVWHGADWGFIIWGALHAVGRCATRDLELTYVYKEQIPRLVKQMAVFAFVTFTWIFFRAQTIEKSWLIIERIFTTDWVDPRFPLLLAALVLAVWIYQLLYTSRTPLRNILEWNTVKVGLTACMIAYLLIVAQSSTKQFIYFQF
jgi:alginate O-acetyltransferase complex protein AlgI